MQRRIPRCTLEGVRDVEVSVHPFATEDGLGLDLRRFRRAECDDVVLLVHGLTLSSDMQQTKDWNTDYALRAGVEGTIRQAAAVTDLHHARYHGLAKTHLKHIYSAVALNLIRLDAWWNGHPLDRT